MLGTEEGLKGRVPCQRDHKHHRHLYVRAQRLLHGLNVFMRMFVICLMNIVMDPPLLTHLRLLALQQLVVLTHRMQPGCPVPVLYTLDVVQATL